MLDSGVFFGPCLLTFISISIGIIIVVQEKALLFCCFPFGLLCVSSYRFVFSFTLVFFFVPYFHPPPPPPPPTLFLVRCSSLLSIHPSSRTHVTNHSSVCYNYMSYSVYRIALCVFRLSCSSSSKNEKSSTQTSPYTYIQTTKSSIHF